MEEEKTNSANKIYKCVYCSRNLGDKVAHRCKGTFRKRNLQFTKPNIKKPITKDCQRIPYER